MMIDDSKCNVNLKTIVNYLPHPSTLALLVVLQGLVVDPTILSVSTIDGTTVVSLRDFLALTAL